MTRVWKKEWGGKPHEWHPSQKGVLDPFSYSTFPTPPLRCQCDVFPVQKSTTERTRSSFGGVQKLLGECVLWYVFLPPYVLHPLYHCPTAGCLVAWFARNDLHDTRFARIGNSSDSGKSAWRAIKIEVWIANDSRESIRANRPCH